MPDRMMAAVGRPTMEAVVGSYIARIDGILAGSSDEDPTVLACEIVAAFLGTIDGIERYRGVVVPGIDCSVSPESLAGLRGRLMVFAAAGYVDPSVCGRDVVNIHNEAVASATAEASLTATFMRLVDAIDRSDLHLGEKAALKDASSGLEAAAKDGDARTFCERLEHVLDLAKRAGETAQAVIPFVSMVAGMFGGTAI